MAEITKALFDHSMLERMSKLSDELQKQQTAETLLNVFRILSNAGEMPGECEPPMIAKGESDAEILARVKRQRDLAKEEK